MTASKYHVPLNGVKALREIAESNAGAGKVKDKLKYLLCTKNQVGAQRNVSKRYRNQLEGAPTAQNRGFDGATKEITVEN